MTYDPSATYEVNYQRGPQTAFHPAGVFPHIRFSGVPRYSFLGVPCYLPLGIPAGPLLHSAFMRVALRAGFCLPVYKTVRSRAHLSHPWPNVLKVRAGALAEHVVAQPLTLPELLSPNDLSITNSFGVPSRTPEEWKADFATLAQSSGWKGCMPVLSFQGSRPENSQQRSFLDDTLECASLAAAACAQASTDILEINLSCPNEGGTPVYQDQATARASLMAVRTVWKGKLIAKIGILGEPQLTRFLAECGPLLNAVSLINTVPAFIQTPEGAPALGSERPIGGVCGASILEPALRAVELAAQIKERLRLSDLEIVGVGGVHSVACVQRHLNAGATVVMAATGAMWNLGLAGETAAALGVVYESVTGSLSSR